jgi:hypothetical protein
LFAPAWKGLATCVKDVNCLAHVQDVAVTPQCTEACDHIYLCKKQYSNGGKMPYEKGSDIQNVQYQNIFLYRYTLPYIDFSFMSSNEPTDANMFCIDQNKYD